MAAKEFRKFFQDLKTAYQNEASLQQFQWIFTAPESPWTNGLAERMIQSVKRILVIKLGNANLTHRQLETLLIEIEGIINKRPLGMVMNEQTGLEIPITPAELMYGKPLNLLPDIRPIKSSIPEAWKHRSTLLGQFWRKFVKDYLISLQPRQKWRDIINPLPRPNDIVLMREDNLTKNEWRLARVDEVKTDSNGIPRYVIVSRPGKKPVLRHLNRIAILETHADSNKTPQGQTTLTVLRALSTRQHGPYQDNSRQTSNKDKSSNNNKDKGNNKDEGNNKDKGRNHTNRQDELAPSHVLAPGQETLQTKWCRLKTY